MFRTLIFVLFFLTVMVENAYAYLDFGTGSYVLQIISASLIGSIVVLKNHIQRIKQIFKRKVRDDETMIKKTNNKRD